MLSSEDILHHIWKYKLYSFQQLQTQDGESLKILSSGIHNHDAGPDFQEAKIEIGETTWAGSVEIHIKSSDWIKHQHQKDKAYDNVILHVVWDADTPILRTDGTQIPTLELKNRVADSIIQNYQLLKENNFWIPCERQVKEVDQFTKQQCLDRMILERLEDKSNLIQALYKESKWSWEDTFYVTLARSFGFKINALPFEVLAKNLPQKLFAKHKDQTILIESLIFGMAGLLNRNFEDAYPLKLKREFEYLKAKYHLQPLAPESWKFARTRPENFPTVRLSQFAALVIRSQHLFSKILDIDDVKSYANLFSDLPVHPYWETHFLFDKEVKKRSIQLGKASINNILINTMAPLLFFYGKQLKDEIYVQKAFGILEKIKPEDNQIIKGFKDLDFKVQHALDTQALIHLKKYFCDRKNCLNCGIGLKILRTA